MNSAVPPTPSLEVAVPSRLEPLRPAPLFEVQRAMQEYQQGLQAILDPTDYQVFVDRRDGSEKRFVKRSGWRKQATWFSLDLTIGSITVERDEVGEPLRAIVVGRVVAPNGRAAEDVGACSITERRFSKPEHDLVATAATRALNRATSNLVGMGELTAEEVVDEDAGVVMALPEWAQTASPELETEMAEKLIELLGNERARSLVNAIRQRYDGTPNIATGLVTAIHSMIAPELERRRARDTEGE